MKFLFKQYLQVVIFSWRIETKTALIVGVGLCLLTWTHMLLYLILPVTQAIALINISTHLGQDKLYPSLSEVTLLWGY